jgi:hypothetical protein
MDGWDLNREESVTSKDLHRFNDQRHHHHYDPQARTKQPDDNPDIEHTVQGSNKQQYKKEIVYDRRAQFPQQFNAHNIRR